MVTPEKFILEGADTSIYPTGTGGRYYKTQENMVVIIINAGTVNTGIVDGTIGVLPVGFRPTGTVRVIVELRSATSGVCAGYVNINTTGIVVAGKLRPAMETSGVQSMVNGLAVFFIE